MIDHHPGPYLSQRTDECIRLSCPLHEEASGLLKEFRAFLGKNSQDAMEEIYTSAFDFGASSSPYVGYHLFGDGNHRGMFLAGLKEHYQTHDFFEGNQSPDHLGVMLRFLARDEDKEERDELLSLRVLPALKKMINGFKDERNPYQKLLKAFLLLLQEDEETVERQITQTTGVEEVGHDG
jgi:nitrate reductase molybdenum cofactor assembly chaperone